ncbi:hypothetical protein ACE193_15180 [Bernardetia sp. OM2101]|uniref:hypothetical protein n=1 Tax=Bernardetia sp. OM2101 TaxID=3344876 RepID=UPI0035D0A7AA
MKTGTKIAVGVGGTLLLGVGGFFAYKHFSKGKDANSKANYDATLFSEEFPETDPLSSVPEQAAQGITQKQARNYTQVSNFFETQRRIAEESGDFNRAAQMTASLEKQARIIKNTEDPETVYNNYLANPNTMTNLFIGKKIKACQANPRDAECQAWNTPLRDYLARKGVI